MRRNVQGRGCHWPQRLSGVTITQVHKMMSYTCDSMCVNQSWVSHASRVTLLFSERYERVDTHRPPGRQPARGQRNDQE